MESRSQGARPRVHSWRPVRRPMLSFGALAVVLTLILAACGGGNQGATGTPANPGQTVAATSGGGESASPAGGESASPAGGESASPAGGESASPGGGESASPGGGESASPGGGASGSPAGGGTVDTGPCKTAPETAVQLTLWNPFTGPDGPFFEQLVTEFNSQHPNVQISVQTQPGPEYVTLVEQAAQSNRLPHILGLGYDQLPLHAENGIVTPIDDLVQELGLTADDFSEATWNAGIWKDQRYGLPIDAHPAVFFYNKALFEQAGLNPDEPPQDKESFEAAIQAINDKTDADGYQLVSSGPGANFLVGLQFASLFYQAGGEWTNADYSEATFNSPAGVQAAEYLVHLANDLQVPKVESDKEIAAFKQKTNAMVISGPWELSGYQAELGDDLGVAPVPSILGEGTWAGSHNLAVTSAAAEGSPERQGAYCFVDWFSRNSVTWAAAGQIPARNEVRESEAFQTSDEGALPFIRQIAPVFESAKFLPSIPGGGAILFDPNGAGEAAVFAINGTKTPQQALDDAAKANTQFLQEAKAEYEF